MEKNEMQLYLINFRGYWREKNKRGVPAEPGIYMVYRCVYDVTTDAVRLNEIIYIGQSDNVQERLGNHEKLPDFTKKLQVGEELCYAFAPVRTKDLDIVENALVFAQKPVLNDKLKEQFNYGEIGRAHV